MKLLVLALAGLVGTSAPPIPEAAKRLYESGSAHFRGKRFEAAAADFERAYAIHQKPSLLHNWALALEKAGRLDAAADVVGRLVTVGSPAEAHDAARWLRDLEARLRKTHAKVTIVVWPREAQVEVNGAVRTVRGGWEPAGSLAVSAATPGYETGALSRTVAAGETVTLSLELRPMGRATDSGAPRQPARAVELAAPLAEVAPDEGASTGVILLGTGGGLVALGAILHLAVALPLASALDGLDAGRADYDAEFDRQADVVEGALMGAWISYGLGAALGIAGGVMMGLEDAPTVEVQVGVGPDGVLRVGGRF